MKKNVEICVYGAEVLCASCVNLPSSKETCEWLQAAISRKYPEQPFTVTYIDIHEPQEDERRKSYAEKVLNDEYFYPLVVIEDTVVGEGNPRLKAVYSELEKYGYLPGAM
ncbi:YuzD family protein [Metabacillus sp. GX 13764]|uniref:YuzD family protein n=1 Tax=Metabacillus kandeliae TaxID=2900151 RepID=UPI001E3EFE81|nr:YuzD family protein [Metabacillus kandeliae]MCD7036249.1 YuzD family protein [Metabacillus kandeliae]